VLAAAAPPAADPAYRDEIASWREQREARLKSESGWLSVAGLFWLKEGASTFGSDPASVVVLPADAPARAGLFVRTGDRVVVRPAAGAALQLEGKPVTQETAVPLDGESLVLGRFQLQAIRRGDRFGIRLRDPESPLRRQFKTLDWFPIDERYRVTARFVPDSRPQTVSVANVLGQTSDEPSPGRIEFELGGRTLSLRPYIEDGDTSQWFYVFHDETAPRLTYGGGRFVYSKPAEDGRVVLDFNKAYNPPCAFNPYTTCPLPPKENRLAIEVPAGERKYQK
jgi:uncharacterized protein (DUF1684 family)